MNFDAIEQAGTEVALDKTPCPFLWIIGWNLGWPKRVNATEETKAKMREAAKQKVYPEDFGELVSKGKKGKKRKSFTEEHKKNMALAQIGRKHPPRSDESRERARQKQTGKKMSEATKQKMRESAKKRWANANRK